MKSQLRTLGIILLLIVGAGIFAAQKQTCEAIELTLPDDAVKKVEIADTAWERSKGLSQRDSLPEDNGMLFLFSTSGRHAFWMKNTRIPLDIIWLKDNKVVDSVTLQPPTGDTIPQHTPMADADAVLELNQGQAAQHGITIGQTISWTECAK